MDQFLYRTVFLICFAAGIAGCAASQEAIEGRVEQSRSMEAYGHYRNEVARSNIDREKSGQLPVRILDREEWARSETAQKEAAGEL